MVTSREDKRADLKRRLRDAAEDQIQARGLQGLKARDVTQAAGCALGGLYNAYEDLDMLVLHVNSHTLERLGAALRAAVPGASDGAPAPTDLDPDPDPDHETTERVLQALAAAYLDFAETNRNLWIALFEHRLPEGREIPDWHRRDHAVLIETLLPPLATLRPDLAPDALLLRARTTFAAVHGVVLLSLQGRFVGLPHDVLRDEVRALVAGMARGARRL